MQSTLFEVCTGLFVMLLSVSDLRRRHGGISDLLCSDLDPGHIVGEQADERDQRRCCIPLAALLPTLWVGAVRCTRGTGM